MFMRILTSTFYRTAILFLMCLMLSLLHASVSRAATDEHLLIKTADHPAVYYVADDSKRYVFPSEKVFNTWKDTLGDITVVSPTELASYKIGGNAVYRPGSRLVKIQSDPTVYFVGHYGTLYPIADEASARYYYGDDWAKQVDDISDGFFVNYNTSNASLAAHESFGPTYRNDVLTANTSYHRTFRRSYPAD